MPSIYQTTGLVLRDGNHAAALPQGRSVVLAGHGHMRFVERPDATLDTLMEIT